MVVKIRHLLLMALLVYEHEGSFNCVENLRRNKNLLEDGRLDFKGLAAKYGHPVEEHQVTTEDGYILTLFHMPGNKTKPVLLAHGDTIDVDSFLIRGNGSLAIFLANKGLDVWAISFRGTIYSQRHVSYDPKVFPERFFNFSFYEQAVHDLPATIDYILRCTGQKQLLAIGHSFGTTLFYALGAQKPEYNDKVSALISLAPICFSQHQKGGAIIGNSIGVFISTVMSQFGIAELMGRNQISTYMFQSFCLGEGPFRYETCVIKGLFSRFGPDHSGFEPEFMKVFYGHYPGGTTRKKFAHTSQIASRDKFAMFDYGPMKNVMVYNKTEPPVFDLSKVRMKVALLVGRADYLSTVRDVERLRSLLPNVVHHEILPYDYFNHGDFLFGQHVSKTLYPVLTKLVDQYV